jgi:phosphatidylserine decarboxylase
MRHHYIDRCSGEIRCERLLGDGLVRLLYSRVREQSPKLFHALTSARASSWLAHINYDSMLSQRLSGKGRFLRSLGVDPDELLDPAEKLNTPRKVFERRIRYEDCRPLAGARRVASPADSRVLVGSLQNSSALYLKEKFFSYKELLGETKTRWLGAFNGGDYAVFRLTPEKYHYNHVPVSGRVVDHYEIEGAHHSCNPGAVVSLVTPFSKNRRSVTIIDSDTRGGSRMGLVAMIEVVALMIGEIMQCYSQEGYDHPQPMIPGMMLNKGQPKSLFRPGSSTVVLLFQPSRIGFSQDLVMNQLRSGIPSRFSAGFGRSLVETEVLVRSSVARALD